MTGPSPVARRLRQLREKAGVSLYEMARQLNFPQASSYQHYETRFKKEFLPLDLVNALKPILMSKGIGEADLNDLAGIKDQGEEVRIGRVPLISWVEAGQMADTTDPYPAGAAADYVLVDAPSENLIGLRVSGNSMDRIAPDGAVIIVDYADKALVDGKFYVVRQGHSMATFKRYRASPPRLEPFSTQPDHPILFPDDDCEVVGRVIKVIHDL